MVIQRDRAWDHSSPVNAQHDCNLSLKALGSISFLVCLWFWNFLRFCTLLTFLTTFARVIKAWSWFPIQETSKHFSKKWYPLSPFSGIFFAARRKFSLLALLRKTPHQMQIRPGGGLYVGESMQNNGTMAFRNCISREKGMETQGCAMEFGKLGV